MSMIDKQKTYEVLTDYYHHSTDIQHKALREALDRVPSVETAADTISRAEAIDVFLTELTKRERKNLLHTWSTVEVKYFITDMMEKLPSVQTDNSKYEYHYDHTDCIWYRPEARNRCPSTCAQYRDGWNDAMNYIFRDGEGYRPYRRDKTYE